MIQIICTKIVVFIQSRYRDFYSDTVFHPLIVSGDCSVTCVKRQEGVFSRRKLGRTITPNSFLKGLNIGVCFVTSDTTNQNHFYEVGCFVTFNLERAHKPPVDGTKWTENVPGVSILFTVTPPLLMGTQEFQKLQPGLETLKRVLGYNRD